MRENISSAKTKQRMAKALESLLNTKPIEKITVSDITDICDMNRQTFYYHFRDIYDLTKWMFAGFAEKIIGSKIDEGEWHEVFLTTARFMKQKKKVLTGIVGSVGHRYLTEFIMNTIKPYIKIRILSKAEGMEVPERYTDFLSNYYTLSFSGLLIEWLITDLDLSTSPEELLRLLTITIDGSVEKALERCMSGN